MRKMKKERKKKCCEAIDSKVERKGKTKKNQINTKINK